MIYTVFTARPPATAAALSANVDKPVRITVDVALNPPLKIIDPAASSVKIPVNPKFPV